MKSTASLPYLSRALFVGLAFVAALVVAGCDRPVAEMAARGQSTRIDAGWHRRALVDQLLAPWLEAAPTPSGFMRTAFERDWTAASAQPGDLTLQARLVYALLAGWETTQDRRFLAAASRGADFLLTRFYDPAHGGFFARVSADGKIVSEAKTLYGNAFALFALSHMFRVTQDARYRDAALRTWTEIDAWWRNPLGGFRSDLPRDFSQAGFRPDAAQSQNPIMHLFEALLALHDATQDPVALEGAKGIADFVVYRLVTGLPDGSAHIPEWYDAGWKALPTREQGGFTDIGHQFEWIHMLLAAERRGLIGVYAQTSERLLKYAVAKGVDDVEGGAFSRVYPDGSVDRDKTWWQQCEAMRAFLAVHANGGQPDMWRRYEQTATLVREQFIDARNGGWHLKACKQGGCQGAQVDPYHMTAMHRAALVMAATR